MSSKKQRMSMLDSLAGAAAQTPGSMMPGNRALKAARDAVDSHRLWELDPEQIDLGTRIRDRLDENDLMDLRDAIEQNGQTVPILVRRDPAHSDRYLLVYGYRRLMAIKASEKVSKIKALVASMGDDDALRAQISENMARRDLSFIEKALFARELVDSGFGSQRDVSEVLTVTKSSISMALSIVDMVGADLVRAIGPAHGIGRPRWEALGKAMAAVRVDPSALIDTAAQARAMAESAPALGVQLAEDFDPSVAAFEAVFAAVPQPVAAPAPPAPARAAAAKPRPQALRLDDRLTGKMQRTPKGVRLDIPQGDFADWLEAEAGTLIPELYARWQERG